MKNKINILIMVIGMIFSSFAYSTSIEYTDGNRIKLDLSFTNPNYIEINGDIITTINYVGTALTSISASSGGMVVNINGQDSFTFFIQTQKGLVIPVEANPIEYKGFYYTVTPKTLKQSPEKQKWETTKNNGYESDLVNIAKLVLNHSPDIKSENPKGNLPKYSIKDLSISPKEMIVGNKINIIKYELKNTTKNSIQVVEKDFIQNNVKSIFFEKNSSTIEPNSTLNIYIVFFKE